MTYPARYPIGPWLDTPAVHKIVAITGRTGIYRNARGEARVVEFFTTKGDVTFLLAGAPSSKWWKIASRSARRRKPATITPPLRPPVATHRGAQCLRSDRANSHPRLLSPTAAPQSLGRGSGSSRLRPMVSVIAPPLPPDEGTR